MNETNNPLISIVTVTYNCQSLIEETLINIISQTYANIELIIIDGASTDDTMNIINRYADHINTCISEKDMGIYDAMNKGVSKASGEWIIFINAGDMFYKNSTLSDIFSDKNQTADIIYGRTEVVHPYFSIIKSTEKLDKRWLKMKFCHQSVLVKLDLVKNFKFNIENKISADLEFFYRCYINKKSFFATDSIISKVVSGGFSELTPLETIKANKKAILACKESGVTQLIFIALYLYTFARSNVKKALPLSARISILKILNKLN